MSRSLSLWSLLFALWAFVDPCVAEAGDVPVAREGDLKAAFIYNFAKFTSWPAGRFATSQAPLIIGVVGSEAVADALAAQLKNRQVAGHPVEVRKLTAPVLPTDLHVLYIGMQADPELPALTTVLERVGLLTIGDSEAFVNRGGIIRFRVEADRLQFQINASAAERKGLKLSSQLLMLAERIPPR